MTGLGSKHRCQKVTKEERRMFIHSECRTFNLSYHQLCVCVPACFTLCVFMCLVRTVDATVQTVHL